MTWKPWKFHAPAVIASVLASLTGLIPLSASFASNREQPPTPGKTSPTLNPSSENRSASQDETSPTRETQRATLAANASDGIPLQKQMAYREARQRLLSRGWQPNLQGEPPNLSDRSVKELFDLGYEEIKDCAGTGEGPCRFEFINGKGELLVVVATTGGAKNTNRFVQRWWIEKQTAPPSRANKIATGFYALGGTDQGLEVAGERYRYYDELGQKPWKPISDLKYIKNGVVFDGKNYWCLSTLVPRNGPAACSANGWTQEILPFVGTRLFNFLGGSGTSQSITITEDGRAVVKLHGSMNTSILYQGKFSNPIVLSDGLGLLLRDNKIYQLQTDGQVAKGCRGAGKPCEAELYQR